jgi:alkanesulfonate monooxygenase SsuD/methylene tetrahydromethanopterin reductase-like flavin-dependent oxidoreductase (luciferase family)
MRRLIQVITASVSQSGIVVTDDRLAQAERLQRMSYEDVVRHLVVYGTPEAVVDRLRQL